MSSAYFGIVLLLCIVGLRWGFATHRRSRFKKEFTRGQVALERHDWVAAEAAFRSCVAIAPTYAVVRRALGHTLARRGKLRDAEEHLRMGAELEPRNAAGYLDLGYFLVLCTPGRDADAIAAFGKAIECAPLLQQRLATDRLLEPLRQDGRFMQLLEPQAPAAALPNTRPKPPGCGPL